MKEISPYLIKRITEKEIKGKSSDRTHKEDVFHASNSGYCLKKIVLSRYYEKPSQDKGMFFGYTWLLHEGLERAFEEFAERTEGVKVETEKTFGDKKYGFKVVGSTDIILETEEEVELFGMTFKPDKSLIDIKTTKNLKYNKQNLKKSHKLQLQTYMWLTGIRKAFLIVVNRTNGEMLFQGPIGYDKDIVKDSLEKFRMAHTYIEEGDIPDINPASLDKSEQWQCDYCSWFQERCFSEW